MSQPVETPSITTGEINRHLVRMRMAWAGVEGLILLVAVAAFFLPPGTCPHVGKGSLTLAAAIGALWLGFSSSRDARRRMLKLRQGFTVHRDPAILLRGHFRAYLVILFRLFVIALCGLVIAVWGEGFVYAIVLSVLAALLTLMTFPTEYKTRLLLKRASQM